MLLITYVCRRLGESKWNYFHTIVKSEFDFLNSTKKYREHNPPLNPGEEYAVVHTLEITEEQAEQLDFLQ